MSEHRARHAIHNRPRAVLYCMPDRSNVQLRALRKAHGLTQEDMAQLLGFSVHSHVSRLERLVREPDIRMAFACEFVLGASAKMLFAPIFEKVTRAVSARARERLDALTHLSNDTSHSHRLSHLSQLALPQPTLFDV